MSEVNKVEKLRKKTRNETIIELMDRYGDMVKKLAFTYVKDMSTAEDVAQDVFISCYHNIHSFQGRSSYKTWIYRITINRSKDVLKSSRFKKWLPFKNDQNHVSKEHSPELRLLKKDDESLVTKSLLSVHEKYRGILYMYFYDELKIKEISEITNLKEGTVKTRISRGKELLRKELERRGLER
ncbi:sigma-70 family RNA polymerase sigma factor [Alkalihalobacillus sp. TS-13]|uniref:sigma-70 family RNA polymerase sigma factor n=1 Tax=Alkalihalobacillus sp. TS-13 TaxID=2842455 RepID=UPI001C86C7A4|nr:sigma-70 family RNA polymerase sigma factor [Alkalihalobacillus sp. TS-13]